MRVEVATAICDGAVRVDRKHPAGPAVASMVVANHGAKCLCRELFCLAMPAPPCSQAIGVDLAALNKQAYGHIGNWCTLHREALLEAPVPPIEAYRRPQRKAVLD